MKTYNTVYIAASLDGYIADQNGSIEFLSSIDIPAGTDMGYEALMQKTDAIVMGRNSFETVCNFDCDWPYTVPVFVLSNNMQSVPQAYSDKAEIVSGSIAKICESLSARNYKRLYIDGGKTIQSFLQADLIDELIITTFPILLGGGASLFGDMPAELKLSLVESKVFLGSIVQSHYRRNQQR